MKHLLKNQNGQASIIVAGALIALVALMAMVVDAGNAYVQKRRVQNATDAAASAGALALAQNLQAGQIYSSITRYVTANGIPTNRVKAYYVVQDASGNNTVVRCSGCTIDAYTGPNNPAPKTIPVSGLNLPVVGVQVEGDLTFNTYFAGVVGWKSMTVGGGAAAFAARGACSAGGLFPLIISAGTFIDETGDGLADIHYQQTDPTYTYTIWENKQTAPGNFGYISWDNDPSATTLVNNMNNPSNSGTWAVNDDVPGATGTMASSNVRAALNSYITSGTPVTIPIYDTVSGSGNNVTYNIKGFARFIITEINYGGQDKYIRGKMQQWVDPQGEGGCTNYGVGSVKVRPPIETKRTLLGTVKLQKITIVTGVTQTPTHVPVDVVNVMDISGSMSASFGNKTKIQAAKDALVAFNNNMKPAEGDKVSLVTFPETQSTSQYSMTCGGKYSTLYKATKRANLTNNISSVNSIINGLSASGGTPIGGGIKAGREVVLGAGHSTSVPVMIFASDGLTNMTLDGKWTGFSGNTYDSPSCNNQAVQDAIDQANITKNAGVMVFSIAVGNDFNPDLMRAIATPNKIVNGQTKTYYYRVTDANSMAAIYQEISQRVQNIATESCKLINSEAFAGGATVVIRNQDTGNQYTVQTTSTGEYVLPNADPGTYQFVSASITMNGFVYNVFTDGVGGPDLASNPTVEVGTGSGTYKADVSLRTSTPLTCP